MRQRKVFLCIIAASMLVVLAACATQIAPENPSEQVFVPTSSSTVSSSGGGITSQPPASQTPDTQTPDSQTPESQAPVTTPPTTHPPATQAPATQPPATQTPTTQPPVSESPATGDDYVAPTNYQEYRALSGEHQIRFINSFGSPADFAAWLKNAKEIYDQESDKTYIDGDTVVDLEKKDN